MNIYTAFALADARWTRLLHAHFGKLAGAVRYTEEGKGKPGSELRRLHDERHAAMLAWWKEAKR